MAFQVEISAKASQDIEEHYSWIEEHNPFAAAKWFNQILVAINSLKEFPERCSKIPEQDSFSQEIRHFIYQKHRIIFIIQDNTVYILAVRHTAKKPLEIGEINVFG